MVRLSAEKRVELWKKFELLDKSGDGKLDFKEMKALLVKSNPNLQDEALKVLFKRIDTNDDGSVDFDEFVDYLYKSPPVYHQAPEICVQKFREFAGKDMDGNEFRNFCLMCNLIDKNFTKHDIDTIFAKVCPRGKRRITLEVPADGFSQYDKLLSILAEKKKVAIEAIWDKVSGGTRMISGTVATDVALHNKQTENMKNRNTDDERAMDNSSSTRTARSKGAARQTSQGSMEDEDDWVHCQVTFDAYNKDGQGLPQNEFSRMCEDVGIAESVFTKGRTVDTIFGQLQTSTLDFEGFQEALRIIAEWKQESVTSVQAIFASSGGP